MQISVHQPALAAHTSTDRQRALILSGGGIRCSYQAGALLALQQHGYGFDFFDATSGGGINLAALLSGVSPEDLAERWSSICLFKSLTMMPLRRYLKQDDQVAMGSADGFRNYVLPHMGIDLSLVRSAVGIAGNFNVLNYASKVVEEIPHTKMDEDFLIAGLSLPGVMPPVQHSGITYLDAAFVQDANLMAAVRSGAEELWVLWCLGNTSQFLGGPLRIYVQMLEMAAHGALHREFEEIAELNQRIASGDSPYGQRSAIKVHLIRPDVPLPLDPEMYLGRVRTDDLIAMGYRDVIQYINRLNPDGVALHPASTVMTMPAAGVRFQQTLVGSMEFDQQKLPLFDLNLSRMMADISLQTRTHLLSGEHEGFSHGSIVIRQADNGPDVRLRCWSGTFRTSASAERPHITQLMLQFGFHHKGENYCLVCRKDIGPRTLLAALRNLMQAWSCTLHQGLDANSTLIAQGNLRASLPDALKTLTKLRISNTSGIGQKLSALCRFIRLLAGKEL